MKGKSGDIADTLPQARITKKSRLQWIWLVPIVAGGIAAWLVYQNVKKSGPSIMIRFEDGKGIQAAQTVIRYRGVRVGEVISVELTDDMKGVSVKARLDKSAANLAREGSRFWVVKADVTAGSVSGLETLVGGPYIEALPGNGAPKNEFDGLKQGPIETQEGGRDITLTWPQLGWLNPGAPLYYRGVEVGIVRDYSLGEYATNIVIHAHVRKRFIPLVRQNSKFWNAGGINADFSLFGGLSVSAETLKSLLVGGIAFATPSPAGTMPTTNQVFQLYEKAEDKWLKWAPQIDIGPSAGGSASDSSFDRPQVSPTTSLPLPKL